MQKHRLLKVYLACAICVIQITGLHLHVHEHTAQHAATEPEAIHLAVATDHGGDSGIAHDQDQDSIVSGPGIIKKAGTDEILLGPAPSSAALQIVFTTARQPAVLSADPGQFQTPLHVRPLLRAPPTQHSV